jgi:hypothetical protein
MLHTAALHSLSFMQGERFTESENLKDVTLYSISNTQAPPTVYVGVLSKVTSFICMPWRHMEGGEVQFHSLLTSIPDKGIQFQLPAVVPWYPLNCGLYMPQSRYGRFDEKKILVPAGTRIPDRPACSLVSTHRLHKFSALLGENYKLVSKNNRLQLIT